jgi:hypothetical protein
LTSRRGAPTRVAPVVWFVLLASACSGGSPTRSSVAAVRPTPATLVGVGDAPTARIKPQIAFDPKTGTVVLFSGVGPDLGGLIDTWTWDGTRWTEQRPSASPPARWGARFAYDPTTQQMLVFGGNPPNGADQGTYSALADVWAWDGASWHRLPSDERRPLCGGPLAIDTADTLTPLGIAASAATSGGPLTMTPPAGDAPLTLDSCRAALAPKTRTVVLLQYYYPPGSDFRHDPNSPKPVLQTWVWQGHWRLVAQAAPAVLSEATLTADPISGQVLAVDRNGDTWRWTGQAWAALPGAARLSAGASLADDPIHHTVVAFGEASPVPHAIDGKNVVTTWLWDGHTWTGRTTPTTAGP